MEKANHIYEMDDLHLGSQLTSLMIWAIEGLIVLWFVLGGAEQLLMMLGDLL